jgi:hypothetical protein
MFSFSFFLCTFAPKHGCGSLSAGVAVRLSWVKTLALAIIQDVPKLAGRKNKSLK